MSAGMIFDDHRNSTISCLQVWNSAMRVKGLLLRASDSVPPLPANVPASPILSHAYLFRGWFMGENPQIRGTSQGTPACLPVCARVFLPLPSVHLPLPICFATLRPSSSQRAAGANSNSSFPIHTGFSSVSPQSPPFFYQRDPSFSPIHHCASLRSCESFQTCDRSAFLLCWTPDLRVQLELSRKATDAL
jgi:hypothetical protein